MTTQIRKGDVGTDFELTILADGEVVPLGPATTLSVIFDKPDGTNVTKTGTLVTDGSDGKLHYVFEEGFLDQAGDWRFQALVVLPTGSWRSEIQTFKVHDNL